MALPGLTSRAVKVNLGTSADQPKICCEAGLTELDNKLLVSLNSAFGMVLVLARDGQLSGRTPSWGSDVIDNKRSVAIEDVIEVDRSCDVRFRIIRLSFRGRLTLGAPLESRGILYAPALAKRDGD